MDWKTELITKLNDLKPDDFEQGIAGIEVSMLIPWDNQFAFLKALACVNSHAIAWVGPGYLMLVASSADRTPDNQASGKLSFRLSRDAKFNAQFKMYDEYDFMSL